MRSFPRYHTGHILIAVILAWAIPGQARTRMDIRFKRFSIEEGLSQSTVETIVQDHEGFIWIGTEDGLNRYDGYEFRIFRSDPDDPNSISANNIWRLYVDRSGMLWIGTFTDGLNSFDPRTEVFTRYLHDPSDRSSISSNRIRSITEDASGDLWIGTRGGGLNRLEKETGRFQRFAHDPGNSNSLISNTVWHVYPDSDGQLWIGTNIGVCRYDPENGAFSRFGPGTGGSDSFTEYTRHIFEDHSGIFWFSTRTGLRRFDPESGLLTKYTHDPSSPGSVSFNNLRRVYEDRQKRLWIATAGGGLNLFNRNEETFHSFKLDQSDPYSLSNNYVRVVFQDRSGIIWIGTMGGGLNSYDPRTSRFIHYRHDPKSSNSLRDPILWSIEQGPDGDIWFGSNSGALARYRRNEDRYIYYENIPSDPDNMGQNNIRSLYWDRSDFFWISSRKGGVDLFNPNDGSIINYRHNPDNPNSLSHNNVRKIYRDRAGNMWFCTWPSGLDHFDRQRNIFTNFKHDPDYPGSLSSDNVISIMQDSEEIYWIATTAGLNRLVFSGESSSGRSDLRSRAKFSSYHHDPSNPKSISNSYIISIHESPSGDLWFGTMQGLSRIRKKDRGNPVFDRYFIKDGLPNDVIYGILEDSNGYLWLSTNFGLSRFDPRTETFRNYDVRDGLQGNEFNSGAYVQTREGTFIFGGVNGATEFHPDSLVDNPFQAPIVITRFNVFDKPALLEESISHADEITLSYKDNYFSFEFASLDFTAPERNQYAYMLEGLDRDWTYCGNRRFAGYTHVDAGKYTFKVKGTNGDGIWNNEYASIGIIITPPFWKTWWFILLLVLAIGGSVASTITYRIRQILKFERLRSKIAADLHDDIGAGLTEISIMGEVITQKLPKESKELVTGEIASIGSTSRSLIDSMSDIVWLVNPRRDSLFDLISRLGDSYKEVLASKNILFKIQNLESLRNIRLNMEYRQNLFLIFKEAVNNSIKHSGCTEIFLGVDLKGKSLRLELKDNGRGFDTEEAATGNGLMNMTARAELIGGILTVNSSEEEGTTIIFRGNIA
jgi:ligand-binding sensor domain-containing protein/two-component sensor histidine kinase